MSVIGKLIQKCLSVFPYVRGLEDRIKTFDKYLGFEPGHYYSPIVEPAEYIEQQKAAESFAKNLTVEIDFRSEEQFSLLKSFTTYYADFVSQMSLKGRFVLDNVFFTYSDALTMYSMMRVMKPKQIIEIGSGFSSALILDTNDVSFHSKIQLTFIDPNPERLKENIKPGEGVKIIEEKIQRIDPIVFDTLNAGDFLLIDTSHVSKSGSDVNHIYFNILPRLKPGVLIHIHDIFFPFEYPAQWIIKENRSWNEVFLLRAFLSYNDSFKIVYFNSFMEDKYREYFESNLPLALKRNSTVCGGIWIEKTK